MAENTLKDMNVIIALSDKAERDQVADIMRRGGAGSVKFAENTLELTLMAIQDDDPIVIAEKKDSVLDLGDTLEYITAQCRFATLAVLADDWSEASRAEFLGSADVFMTRKTFERGLLPGILVVAARKKHMRDLETEYRDAEYRFAKDKNLSFAEHVIMDTLGLSKESAGEYIKTLAERHGMDEGEVSKIVYDVLLSGRKN